LTYLTFYPGDGVATNPTFGLDRELGRRPEGEREVLLRLFSEVGRLLLEGSPEQVLRLERRLREDLGEERLPEDPVHADERLLRELEAENLLRVYAGYREIELRSVPGEELRRRLGVSRQRLEQLRAQRRLLGMRLPFRKSYYYPVWQFDEEGEPLASMPRLLKAAEEAGMDAEDLDAFMTNAAVGDGRAPHELLKAGEEEPVLSWIGAALAHGT
jgi:hypothetical protein